ncbi:MAG: precorrin-3B synthase [Proteobacteria bacterium]|nr:precorrin-3B synthase [Pseudomonadota bacterium]
MTSMDHLRKGWCPGAHRPMRSGDGLLVRVRPRAGSLSLASLRAIGSMAAQFGSGEIDLTNRGNLQIRGVTDDAFVALLGALDMAGLLDPSVEAEAVRNVVVDPLSGLDPQRADVRDLSASLEELLLRDVRLWSLPGKFKFSFSGVAAPRVGGRSADIMMAAGDDYFSIALDGAIGMRCDVARGNVVDAIHRLALAFVELKENDASFRRMRDAVARFGVARVFGLAGLQIPTISAGTEASGAPVGLLRRNESVFGVGVGLPFGRITADHLAVLCEHATAAGIEDVRTSPERVLVFPVSDAPRADELLRRANVAGLIVREDDIRLAMDVCPGSPACKNSRADTRRDAQRFADGFAGSLHGCSLHISGCEKGCARRTEASFTLVGRAGRYDIIRDGSADSMHVHDTIDADDLAAAISRLSLESAV